MTALARKPISRTGRYLDAARQGARWLVIGLFLSATAAGAADDPREVQLRDGVAAADAAYGETSRQSGDALTALGRYLEADGRKSASLVVADRILDRLERMLPRGLQIADLRSELGMEHASIGEFDAAILMFERSLDLVERQADLDPRRLVVALNNIAFGYCKIDRCNKAVPLYERALLVADAYPAQTLAERQQLLDGLGTAYRATGRDEAAHRLAARDLLASIDAADRDVAAAKAASGIGSLDVAKALILKARVLATAGDAAAATRCSSRRSRRSIGFHDPNRADPHW